MPKSLVSVPATLMLLCGCAATAILPVQTPDVINPVCLSSRIGIGASPATREVASISKTLSAEHTPVEYSNRWKTVNTFQENVMEHMKGSRRRAVRDVTVDVTNLHIYAFLYIADKLFVVESKKLCGAKLCFWLELRHFFVSAAQHLRGRIGD